MKKTETKTARQFHPLVSFNNTPYSQELKSKFPSICCKLTYRKGNEKASLKWPEYWFNFISGGLKVLSCDSKSLSWYKCSTHGNQQPSRKCSKCVTKQHLKPVSIVTSGVCFTWGSLRTERSLAEINCTWITYYRRRLMEKGKKLNRNWFFLKS